MRGTTNTQDETKLGFVNKLTDAVTKTETGEVPLLEGNNYVESLPDSGKRLGKKHRRYLKK
jgi:hypothetical protein